MQWDDPFANRAVDIRAFRKRRRLSWSNSMFSWGKLARAVTCMFSRRQPGSDSRFFFPLQVVIVQPVDSGNKAHPYGHALVAGIERYPSKITRRMSKTRQEKRSKIKPFIKAVNYNHLMPTRYTLELEGLKGVLSADTFKEVSQREDAKKNVKKVLEERYTSGKNRWFFTPLSMFKSPTPSRPAYPRGQSTPVATMLPPGHAVFLQPHLLT
ncbi:ribosomal L27e protein family-domain-containing protein [Microdochium bolleyi]|uniref:Ribosomal L27e protein family-domain-containing protein n=1 Tax=Microdochium bolleyi TaxID=196109 RepID=A0A136JII7_9PEZI|nr:ribosomal L27e protein family-domain-containing protein [Microdochium bolleyi]